MLERFGSGNPSLGADHQTRRHQVQKLRVLLAYQLLRLTSPQIIKNPQRRLFADVLLLRVVELVQQKAPLVVEIPPLSGRRRLQHLLGNLPHDLLDQREVEQVVVLPVTPGRSPHGLEEQVAGEELHRDAGGAPDVRLLVPGQAEQHLRSAVLARVDGPRASLGGVGRAAEVDH